MKTYNNYKEQANCISLGQICVFNELLDSENKTYRFKELDGYIFLFLADTNLNDFLKDNFSDYSTYFDIDMIDQHILKEENKKLYNIYQLKSK